MDIVNRKNDNYKFLLDFHWINNAAGKRNYLCLLKEDLSDPSEPEFLSREIGIMKKYLEESSAIIAVLDRDLNTRYINKKGLQVIGFRREDVQGKNWLDDFIPQDLRKRISLDYKKLLNGKISFPKYYINDIMNKKGNKKTILWHSSFIKND